MKLAAMAKRGLNAKTVLLYVTYAALTVVSGGVCEGNVAFGLFVGAVYSANPIVAAVIYLGSAAVYGWISLLHAAVKMAIVLVFVGIHYFAKRKINKLALLIYLVVANVFYVVYSFIDYFSLFDRILRKLVEMERKENGREKETTMIIVDSKSIQNADTAENKGYDAGKKLPE